MTVAEFDLKMLCERARVTPRTVHFYMQQGLLPPAGAPGPGARYGEGHVGRLRLIRLLKAQHLPLAEIGKRLKGLTDDQVDVLLKEAKARRQKQGGSALEYIRGVLGEQKANPAPIAARSALFASLMERMPIASKSIPSMGLTGSETGRSQWERFTLTDGIELHVRRPLARSAQRQLDTMLAAVRNIFEPEEEE
ncbi:MAG: MerR family transcriptional regulator [Thermoleophilaceae bacterium]|nr:MerR family transcriptional regulator [Thermoleophilaceae bacterium]